MGTLRELSGMRLWMLTRVLGPDQLVLAALDDSTAPADAPRAAPGTVLPWGTSLCRAMVAGAGPTTAPDLRQVPAYAQSLNAQQAGIRAYVGAPLHGGDGRLFGTLCAFDDRPRPDSLHALAPQVHLTARLLSTVLELEMRAEHQRRLAEHALQVAEQDALTGLPNRRAWDRALAREQARCTRYGHPASVVVVDLNGFKAVNDTRGHPAGDELLRACADRLRSGTRAGDLVARLGGDEFALLLPECDAAGAARELERVRAGLASAGIDAAAGVATRTSAGDLVGTWHQADAAMYAVKHGAERDAEHSGSR
nr:sensor domain-containing diguanylate cyclase [Kineococcus vitellinus]